MALQAEYDGEYLSIRDTTDSKVILRAAKAEK